MAGNIGARVTSLAINLWGVSSVIDLAAVGTISNINLNKDVVGGLAVESNKTPWRLLRDKSRFVWRVCFAFLNFIVNLAVSEWTLLRFI